MVYLFTPSLEHSLATRRFFALARALRLCGVPCAVATAEGLAPISFMAGEPVVDREEALAGMRPGDHAIFDNTAPQSSRAKATRPLRFNGTTLSGAGTTPISVGASVSSLFYYDGSPKFEDVAAYSGIRDETRLLQLMKVAPAIEYLAADTEHEVSAARHLKLASVAVWSGSFDESLVSPLEAMASGCVLLAASTVADRETLRHGDNAWVCEAAELPERLAWLLKDEQAGLRRRLRDGAVATASRLRPIFLEERLRKLLAGPLRLLAC